MSKDLTELGGSRKILKLPGKRTCPYPRRDAVRAHLQRHIQRSGLQRDLRDTRNVSKSDQNKGMADFLKNGPIRVESVMDIARRTTKPDEIAKCLAALTSFTFPVGVVIDRGGLLYALTLSTHKDIDVQRALCMFLNRICAENKMKEKYIIDDTLRIALRALFLRDPKNGMPATARSALALILSVHRKYKLTVNRVEEIANYVLRSLCSSELLLNVYVVFIIPDVGLA